MRMMFLRKSRLSSNTIIQLPHTHIASSDLFNSLLPKFNISNSLRFISNSAEQHKISSDRNSSDRNSSDRNSSDRISNDSSNSADGIPSTSNKHSGMFHHRCTNPNHQHGKKGDGSSHASGSWTKLEGTELVNAERDGNEILGGDENRWKQTALQISKNSLITRRRIPPNFIKDVFIPHLETWIWEAKMCPSWYLVEAVVAYSQMPVINKSLTTVLADTVISRILDYNGPDFVKMLFPFYRMRPTDTVLFAHFSIELEEHFYELTTLNLIAIVRVYARLQKNQQQIDFIETMVIPRLQVDIAKYDTEELSALLVSLAASAKMSTTSDVPLLAAIIPQIEKRYDETPLLTSIININALCRLRVFHKRLLDLSSKDLSDRWRVRNIPPKYIAVAIWTFARFGLLNRILPAFEELIEDNADKFSAREFARFCQALPDDSPIILKLSLSLLEKLPEMTRDNFAFFFVGVVRRGFLPTRTGETPKVATIEESRGPDEAEDESEGREFYHLETDDPSLVDPESIVNSCSGESPDVKDAEINLSDGEIKTKIVAEDDDVISEDHIAEIPRETILHECIQYIEAFENDFDADEIHRIGHILRHSVDQQYGYISTLLPKSWESIINEVMVMGK